MKAFYRVCCIWSVAIVLVSLGCSQTQEQYVPRYSADQVIAVVRKDFPTAAKQDINGIARQPTQISARFVGGLSHSWKATITCPKGYVLTEVSGQPSDYYVYFWETDGHLYYYYVSTSGQEIR